MRADWIKLMIAAARLPLRSEPANNQLERPSIGTAPSSSSAQRIHQGLELHAGLPYPLSQC